MANHQSDNPLKIGKVQDTKKVELVAETKLDLSKPGQHEPKDAKAREKSGTRFAEIDHTEQPVDVTGKRKGEDDQEATKKQRMWDDHLSTLAKQIVGGLNLALENLHTAIDEQGMQDYINLTPLASEIDSIETKILSIPSDAETTKVT